MLKLETLLSIVCTWRSENAQPSKQQQIEFEIGPFDWEPANLPLSYLSPPLLLKNTSNKALALSVSQPSMPQWNAQLRTRKEQTDTAVALIVTCCACLSFTRFACCCRSCCIWCSCTAVSGFVSCPTCWIVPPVVNKTHTDMTRLLESLICHKKLRSHYHEIKRFS